MAEFTQKQNDTGISDAYSNVRTLPANTALQSLFEGIGRVGGAAVQVVDQQNKKTIRDELQHGVDTIQNEFGVQAASQITGTDISNPKQPLPVDLQNSAQQLQDLQTGVQQGRVSQTVYYARLDAMVRQMRARYPGYRDEIDKITESITGVTPANALQRSLMDDAVRNANAASESQKSNEAYLNANEAYLPIDARRGLAEGRYSMLQLHEIASHAKQLKAQNEADTARMASLASQNNLQSGLAVKNASKTFNSIVDHALSTATGDFKSFQEALARAEEGAKKGDSTPEERRALANAFNQLYTNTSLQIESAAAQPWSEGGQSYNSFLADKPEMLKAAKESALRRLDAIKTALDNKDYGLLNAMATEVQAKKDGAALDLFNGPGGESVLLMGEFQKAVGPTFANAVFMTNPGILSQVQQALTNAATAHLGTGRGGMNEVLQTLQNDGTADASAYAGVLKNAQDALISKDITQRGFENNANALFGPEQYAWLSLIKPDERLQVFNNLTSPAVTEAMKERSKVNPALWEQYRSWVADRFLTLYHQQRTALDTAGGYSFNPQSQQLEQGQVNTPSFGEQARAMAGDGVVHAGTVAMTAIDRALSGWNSRQGAEAAQQLNATLKSLSGIFTPEELTKLVGAQQTSGEDVASKDLIDVTKKVENDTGAGLKNGRYHPVPSLEGGTPTIAFGHKLTPEEVKSGKIHGIDYTKGLSPDEAEQVLNTDLDNAQVTAKAQWEKLSSGKIKFDDLPPSSQGILVEKVFNTGSLQKFPKLLKAIEEGDAAAIRKEMVTSYVKPDGSRVQLAGRAKIVADGLGIG